MSGESGDRAKDTVTTTTKCVVFAVGLVLSVAIAVATRPIVRWWLGL